MKTSKVVRIEEIKEWGTGDRKTYYHSLEMENGDKINIGKKKHLEVGEELHYEIVDTTQEYNKAKSVNPEFQNRQSTGNTQGGLNVSDSILYQSQLKAACEIVAFDGWDGIEDMKGKLEHLSNMAYQLSVLAKEKINKL